MADARVLVGFAESLAAIESIWDLLDAGHEVHAFARRGRRPPIAHDRRVTVTAVTPPEVDLGATVGEVAALAGALGRPVLAPLDDAAVLVLDEVHRGDPEGVLAGPAGAAARLCLDKRVQLEQAAHAGLTVPPTLVVGPGDPHGVPSFPPPWIVKPALALEVTDGRVSKGPTRFVTDAAALGHELSTRADTVLVQPALTGTGIGVFGLAIGGSATALSGHRRVRMMNPSGSGSSACRAADPGPELLAQADKFVARTGWRGLFMLEFLEDADGTPWLMELNGRPWGSMALAVGRRLRYPSWSVAAARDPDFLPPVPAAPPPLTARHLGRELLHLAFVVRGRRELRRRRRAGDPPRPDLAAYPTVRRALRDLVTWQRPSRLYNVRRGRLRVLAADTVDTLRSVLANRGGH